MNWNNAPDFEEVKTKFKRFAAIKAEIKILEEEIEDIGIDIKKESPRKPHLIRDACKEQYKKLSPLYAEKESLEIELRFFDFWKDMFKSYGYNHR
jgi:hypothetical protein